MRRNYFNGIQKLFIIYLLFYNEPLWPLVKSESWVFENKNWTNVADTPTVYRYK